MGLLCITLESKKTWLLAGIAVNISWKRTFCLWQTNECSALKVIISKIMCCTNIFLLTYSLCNICIVQDCQRTGQCGSDDGKNIRCSTTQCKSAVVLTARHTWCHCSYNTHDVMRCCKFLLVISQKGYTFDLSWIRN